jgi:hypothetical protein
MQIYPSLTDKAFPGHLHRGGGKTDQRRDGQSSGCQGWTFCRIGEAPEVERRWLTPRLASTSPFD